MKAERRHDLQHNVLDSELAKIVEFFHKYGNQLFWGAVIAVAVVLIVVFARGKLRQRRLEAYSRYGHLWASVEMDLDERIDEWTDFAQNTRNQRLAGLALVAAGNDNLMLFLEARAADRRTRLAQAEELYRRVVAEFAEEPAAASKAHFGLSTVAQNRRDWDTARQELEAVLAIAEMTGTPATAEAERMLERLNSLAEPVAFVSRPLITPLEAMEGSVIPGGPGPEEGFTLPGEFDLPQLP